MNTDNPEKEASITIEEHFINLFYERAKKLHKRATRFLWLMIGILTIGIAAIAFADWLTSLGINKSIEESRSSNLVFIDNQLDITRNSIETIKKEIKDLNQMVNREITGANIKIEGNQKMYIDELNRQIKDAIEEHKSLNQRHDNEVQMKLTVTSDLMQTDAKQQESNINKLQPTISATATRIGAILLLIFLGKFLIPLYRYNLKIASHYDSLGDALKLAQGDISKDSHRNVFERLTAILSPEKIDFEPAPNSPADNVTDLIKQTIETSKSK
jgi:hypothetical protein